MREDFLQKRWPSLFLIQLSKLFRSFSGFMKNHMGKEWSRWTIIAQCEPHLGVWQEGKGIWSDRREMSRWIFLNKNWAQRLSSSSSRKFRQIISWFSSSHRNLMTIYRTKRWRHNLCSFWPEVIFWIFKLCYETNFPRNLRKKM